MAKRSISFPAEEGCSSDKKNRCELLSNHSELSVEDRVMVVNETLKLWLEIFPDADPDYLCKKYNEIKDSRLKMEQFISDKLDHRNYPKLADKLKNLTGQEEKNFYKYYSVDKFVTRFPDAVKYFSDENRRSVISRMEAVAYMTKRFPNHKLSTIRRCVDTTNNLTLACKKISCLEPDRVIQRPLEEDKVLKEPTIELLKEITFVEHQSEIIEYIEQKQEKRMLAYTDAQKKKELVECGCCYEDLLFEECTVCEDGDLFCKNCVRKSTEVRIGEGHITFPCLKDCGANFSFHILQEVLDETVFGKLMKRIQSKEVQAAGISGLESCPFCEFAAIPPPDSRIFTCLNPECGKESCRFCQKVSHIPLRCEEVETDDEIKKRVYIENKMTEALVRTCWNCKAQFVKEMGCNKMQCACGAVMCYVCRQRVLNYSHFRNSEKESGKCPLFSSDKVLHVDVIKAVGEQAKRNVGINSDTTLKNDPTQIKIRNRCETSVRHEDAEGLQKQVLDVVFSSDNKK